MTEKVNTDKTTEYGVPFDYEWHDEWETDFHAAEQADVNLGSVEDWQKRHTDKTLDVYCDMHPSAPECKIFDE